MAKSRSEKQKRVETLTENPTFAAVAVGAAAPAVTTRAPLTLQIISRQVTLQRVAYAALLGIAFLLRVMNLDARPLAPTEAQTAAAAWEFLNGKPITEFSSPLLFTLDWLAFLLFGAFDLTARFLPAGASALLVLLPCLARAALGRAGALCAALLIAVSPSLVFFGRYLDASGLAVGGMLAALILFAHFRATQNTRRLYLAAVFAALALTADATAFTILGGGALYFALARARRAQVQGETVARNADAPLGHNPYLRAALLFGLTYGLAASTFLLNRDGVGAAFDLFGAWLAIGPNVDAFTSSLSLLWVYEPLALIFGVAGIALALTARDADATTWALTRMFAVIALFALGWHMLRARQTPGAMTTLTLPLLLLAGWLGGVLLERAAAEIRAGGGWSSALTGELPIFLMLLLLTVLIYFQVGAFLQQTHFSPALDAFYRVLSGGSENSALAAFMTLGLITLVLLAVFIGLSIVLVGVSRTTSLLALAVGAILLLGQLRALWLLNFDMNEPLREIIVTTQTPRHLRTLVQDLEWYSQIRHGDAHVMRIAADKELGATGRWYLREFVNIEWTRQVERAADAQALVSAVETPPPGNWMGQRYAVQREWTLANANGLDLWKWFVFRQGGSESTQTTMMWLPTEH